VYRKSEDTIFAQREMVTLRKQGHRATSFWKKRCVEWHRYRDTHPSELCEVDWEHPSPTRTRFING
jgi:hypothetical protein